MKKLLAFFSAACLILSSCSETKSTSDELVGDTPEPEIEIEFPYFLSLHHPTDSGVYRWTIESNEGFHVLRSYLLEPGEYSTTQTYLSTENITNQEKDSILNTHTWKSYAPKEDILFVVLPKSEFPDSSARAQIRRNLDYKMKGALEREDAGSMFGSSELRDGSGIFFEISRLELGLDLIYQELHKAEMQQKALIGHRLFLNDSTWVPEILFPLEYSGVIDERVSQGFLDALSEE